MTTPHRSHLRAHIRSTLEIGRRIIYQNHVNLSKQSLDSTVTQDDEMSMKRKKGKLLWLALLVGAAVLMGWAGCGEPEDDRPNPLENCASDTDCEGNRYCSSSGVCRQDCDPGDESGCGAAESCTQNGRCVALSCQNNEGCPGGFHCADGQCDRECGEGRDLSCVEGQECDDRGQCVTAIEGECTADADCDDAPETTCTEGTLVEYAPSGTCKVEGQQSSCIYQSNETTCEYGCDGDACAEDPCQGVACDMPPEAKCSEDGNAVLTYNPDSGTCNTDKGGSCEYTASEKSCAFGCQDGSCNDGPCDQVTCDMPPSARCDGDTAVTYTMTPGKCVETDDGTTCDYGETFEDCRYTNATCDNGACNGAVNQTGTVLIVEYMANPAGIADSSGEWFEVRNTTNQGVDLKGWSIASAGNSDHVIGESVTVPAQGRAILAIDSDPAGDGSISPDYVYSGIRLANGTDSLFLKDDNGDVSDFVFYEAGAIMRGRSRKLDPALMLSATINDDFTNWCPSLADADAYGAGSDYGTPGAKNSACDAMPCQSFTCEKPEGFCKDGDAVRPTKDMATCTKTGFNNPNCDFGVKTFNCTTDQICVTGNCENVPQDVPAAGEVIITELMGNPDAVSDSDGEWVELYNTTGKKLSLFSVRLEDNEMGGKKDSHQILDPMAEIPANGYVLLAVETDMAKNGGISGAFHYTGGHLKNSPGPNMTIRLVQRDGTLIDEVPYKQTATGESQQLDKATYMSAMNPGAANDDATKWCKAKQTYGAGDKGTPGAGNTPCAANMP